MTKKAFMDELLRGLAPLNTRQRQEIQSDFDEHFAEGRSMGLSEEEICRQLGQPAQIAEQFLEDARFVSDDTPRRNAEPTQADSTDKQAYDHDFDINRTFETVRLVSIELRNSRLSIKSNGSSEKIVVQVRGGAQLDRFCAESRNNELVIRDGDYVGWLDMLFMLRSRVETTVWLPEHFQGDVNIYVKNGETIIAGVSGNRLKAKNTLQKVVVENCRFNYIDVNVSAGNLHMNDCTAHDMKLRSAAGNVSVEAPTINDLTASSAAGNVVVKADRLTGDIRLDASAGAVRLQTGELFGNIDARSAAGTVTLLLPPDVNARFETHSNMGSVTQKIAGNAQSPFTVRASSSMGSVLIKAAY